MRILFLRLDEDIIDPVKERFKTLIAPYYVLRMKSLRGKRHGEQRLQEGDWKAQGASRGAKQHHYSSLLDRWRNDQTCRNSQKKNNIMGRNLFRTFGLPQQS